MEKRMITKVLPFEVKEVAPRTLEFIGSTEDKDRQGDIIMASGWNLKQYKKNPVFMWAHHYDEPPVGKAVKVWASDGQLRFHVQFAEKEVYEFADTIYKLYKGGYLRASSVGFLPIESEPIDKDDEGFFGVPTRFLKQELLELSGCPVPANPDALAEAKAKGLLFERDLSRFEPQLEDAAEKPYPNEHACRLRNPDTFQDDSFKRTEREHEGKKYSVIMGKLEGETTMTEQAYRYAKEVWTAPDARKHCEEHDGTFEPASANDVDAAEILSEEEHPKDFPAKREISQAAIADDLDYLITAIHDQGLNEENCQLAWALVDVIMRDSGSDIPVDIAEKIGAVLNKANRERLERIQSLAQEVLDSAEKEDEPEKSLTQEEIQESISNSVVAAIEKAKGKLRR